MPLSRVHVVVRSGPRASTKGVIVPACVLEGIRCHRLKLAVSVAKYHEGSGLLLIACGASRRMAIRCPARIDDYVIRSHVLKLGIAVTENLECPAGLLEAGSHSGGLTIRCPAGNDDQVIRGCRLELSVAIAENLKCSTALLEAGGCAACSAICCSVHELGIPRRRA